ncbi:MAG: DUF302 domain-containing protein [Gammaproteobacteria bacterium]|nr:DUF302 domain-containing protein [Gammaproteobacteria bacterium]MCZ6893145.1 DUF302 domain-containing protein [Gammaproteobacteria bacterium]
MRAAVVCLALVLVMPFGDAHPSEPRPESTDLIVRYVVDKPFSDVIFELNFAITERNFRITGRNTIGEGLRKRGYENFPNIEVIHFCSLEKAREVLMIDPGFVAQMPCRIAVHEQGGKTVISLITLPLDHPDPRVNDFARRMNAILTEIVEFTLDSNGD